MESSSAISGAIPKAAAAAGKTEGAIEAEEKAPASIAREDSVSAKRSQAIAKDAQDARDAEALKDSAFGAGPSAEDVAEKKRRSALRESLRAQLSKMLGSSQAAEEALRGSAQFTGELAAGNGEGLQNSEEAAAISTTAIGSFLKSSDSQTPESFSMSAAEADTSEFLKRSELPEAQSGILAMESFSLFERVQYAHRACLKRQCVISNHVL
ncbi:MAG: hypothetical protein EOP11_00880 [Proteobacteria bacterium]|nr:MAG: hypothetical protein EOP11_00880 [Pseudomonadota bacterium]